MSKSGAIGRFIGTILSFFTRLIVNILQYAALCISIGVAVYTVGEYTRQIIHKNRTVLEVVYWRDPKRSGIALAAILVGLWLVAKCSVLSLVAYTSLAVLAGTLGFRVFKLIEAQIKKTDGSNPFKPYLEQEISVPQERLHSQVDIFVEHGQCALKQLRHLFLVESVVDSIKFGLLLYTLTYVGAWFSGFTLIVLFVLSVFSVPKVYELYKEPIDQYVGLAKENLDKVHHQVTDKLPFLKKVTEGEKKEQ